mmetsp:Transcript_464/g.1146  ORF Transcript_464/g.1146 Transcript_464/m.1146 type:complete len:309 (+) Transcript_464:249-1175(+)
MFSGATSAPDTGSASFPSPSPLRPFCFRASLFRLIHHPSPRTLLLSNGSTLNYDIALLSTGAAAAPWLRSSTDLATSSSGFLLVHPTLQCVGHPHVFAAGDCAGPLPNDDVAAAGEAVDALLRNVPKAGVYAVRQAATLRRNVVAACKAIAGAAAAADDEEKKGGGAGVKEALKALDLDDYVPQRGFLSLLSLGNKSAVGTKWGVAFEGPWVWKLKDHIDQSWMRQFPALASTPAAAAARAKLVADMASGGDSAVSAAAREVAGMDAEKAAALMRDTEAEDYMVPLAVLDRMRDEDGFREAVVKGMAD